MVFIEYDERSHGKYVTERYDLMTELWGSSLKPYVDDTGVPRIGPNISLRDSMYEVVTVLLGSADDDLVGLLLDEVNKSYGKNDDGLLKTNLNNVLEQWVEDHDLPSSQKKFELAGQGEVKEVIEAALLNIESSLQSWGDSGIPESDERAVLASLFQEGVDMDDIMEEVWDNGDRSNAWFEIRYDTNTIGNAADKRDTAARRYIQSDMFELYNEPNGVSYDEALQVAAMYSAHRQVINEYEDKYDPSAGGGQANGKGGKGNDTIADALQPAIKAVAKNFQVEVGRAEELLFVGRINLDGDGTPFDNKKNDDDMIIGNFRDNRIDGGKGNDVIVGLGGSDVLIGDVGTDNLYGGVGKDTLRAGAGNDKLFGGGGAGDRLIGGKGNDTYYLDDDDANDPGGPPDPSLLGGANDDVVSEEKNGGNDTVIVRVDGSFNLKEIEKFKLAGDVGGNVSLVLNQFDMFTLSNGSDKLTLTINKLQKDAIDIVTNGGADTIRIKLSPGIDPSQVLDHKGVTARFDFADLSANDTIDLTSINIKKIVTNNFSIDDDQGFYLMAPGAKIALMDGNHVEKTYNNSTDSWFVVKCGDDTPYGPEFLGNIDKSNFDI